MLELLTPNKVLGKFITIEGSEGAGKSTALQFIKDYLTATHIDTVWTREPGGTVLAEELRRMLLRPVIQEEIMPKTELLLMFAARVQHLEKCILPALRNNQWVVSDRFIDASYAYQGGGRGIPLDDIAILDKLIVANHYPDLTLLLDIPPEVGFQRAEKRGTEKDRIEQEQLDFFAHVRETYLLRAQQDPNRIKIIDASKSLPEVQTQIRHTLDEFIARKPTS